MLVRERRDTDRKGAVRAQERHQLGRVRESLRMGDPVTHRVARWIAPQRQHVADAGISQPPHNGTQLRDRVINRSQVGDWQQRRVGRDLLGDLNRVIPGAAAGTVGDRDEGRVERL